MKTISLRQPWAYLLCSGIKDIENRTWKCPQKYIGERVLIHASAKWDDRHRNMSQLFTYDQWKLLPPHIQVMMSHGILPTSAIIGSVRFVDCVINHPSIWAEKTSFSQSVILNNDLTVKGYRVKEEKTIYNWVATDTVLFEKPILNVKGRLNFWDFDLPEEYVKLINDYDNGKKDL